MATLQYESTVKYVPYSQERVYNKLSDLNNLESVRQRLDAVKDKLEGKLEDMTFDQDSITLKVQGISLTLRIIEREPMKCIKFEGDKSPVPMNLWIQMLPVSDDQSKMAFGYTLLISFYFRTKNHTGIWLRNFGKKMFR